MRIGLRLAFLLTASLLVFSLACSNNSTDKASDTNGGSNGSSGSTTASALKLSQVVSSVEEVTSLRFDASLKLDVADADLGSLLDSLLGKDEGSGSFSDLVPMLGLLGDNIEVEGAFAAPDSAQFKLTLDGTSLEFIQIADRSWWREDGGDWQEVTLEDFSLDADSLDVTVDDLPDDILDAADLSSESVNGVETTRYSFDKDALVEVLKAEGVTLDTDFLKKADFDLWLTDGGVPLKLTLDIEGEDQQGNTFGIEFELNITDLNQQVTISEPS